MEYLLEAKNLTKTYGNTHALTDFSIKIPKGSIYGLLGPNGAGKTTFIRMINQITLPDAGEILLNGEPLNPQHINQIGYMPEERGLYKNMSIGDQCIYLAKLKGLDKTEAKEQLEYWFDKLDIQKWWNLKLSELSKGMAQKIQFVVTVLHQPLLLIFDEPFSGFDPVNANLIRDEILELKEKGATIIFSTHRMESVEEMCDYVALINHSKKILDGEIQTVRNDFKEGKFYFEVEHPNKEVLLQLEKQVEIENFQNKGSYISFILNENSDLNSNELLNKISDLGIIKAYYEIIPKMNEVFIKAVK